MTNYIHEITSYIETEKRILDSLSKDEINTVMNVLEEARLSGKRIFICGNGGSAATASHFCGDFNKGISLDQDVKYNLECLSDNIPMMMAIANDISYDDVFVIPLKNKMKKGDVVIGISGSGNSKNVVKALEYANEIGGTTIALSGYSGGKIKEIARYGIHVAVDNMQIVEDVHMALNHLMVYILSNMDEC